MAGLVGRELANGWQCDNPEANDFWPHAVSKSYDGVFVGMYRGGFSGRIFVATLRTVFDIRGWHLALRHEPRLIAVPN
jgi:hypothetical protein